MLHIESVMQSSSGLAFFKFHLRVGIRLALRVLVAAVALFFALFYLLKPELFIGITAQLISDGLPGGMAAALSCLVFAGIASRRISLGLAGWIRHLPASGSLHRRMAAMAVLTAQFPILLIWMILALAAGRIHGVVVAPFLTGLLFSAAAAALAVIPVQRKYLVIPLAVSAAVLAGSSSWIFLGAGTILIFAADLFAGPVVPVRSRMVFALPNRIAFHLTIVWRALRWRLIMPYITALFPIGLSFFFLANNTVGPRLAVAVVTVNGALGLVLFCGSLANILVSRRPPWPWARSFPVKAATRILNDALVLGLHAVILLVPVALAKFSALWPLAAALPFISIRGARAIHVSGTVRGGVLALLAKESILWVLLIGLFPPASLFLLPAAPVALKEAAKTEKSQKVSRWLELHHLAAGDPLSWSRQ